MLFLHLGRIAVAMNLLSARVINRLVDASMPIQLWIERAEMTAA
jgi:hypothetical protein